MADNRTPAERQNNMRSVRNRGSQPEMKLLAIVMEQGITGWRRNYKRAYGTPDLAFPKSKVAIFVDGCFWHGCSCKTTPITNREFWVKKIATNCARDEAVTSRLQSLGWVVWRIREHEFRDAGAIACILSRLLVNRMG